MTRPAKRKRSQSEGRVMIDLPIDWSYGRGGVWRDVKAEIVDIAPHLANVATFAVHRYPKSELWRGKWGVSNVETGFGIRRGETRDAAIEAATKCLRDKSVQKVVGVIRAACATPADRRAGGGKG